MAKMTYAQIAEKLNKQYNKYDKNLQNAVTDAEKNSAMMMLQRVSSRLNQLMVSNQNDADMQDAKNTPADSPNQSIGQRTMRMAKNGGSLKSIPKGKKGKGLSELSKKVRNKIGYMQGGGSTDPENNIVYTYAPGVTAESMYPGSVTLDDLRGTEVFSGLEPVNGMHANFLNFINTGHSGYLPKDNPGKHQAMRKHYLQSGKVQDNANLRTGALPVPKFDKGGKLYDGLTQEAIQEYMYEAGIITGLGDKFDPTNSDHVRKLQEGMLGAFTGKRADRMLSGNESAYINKGGEFSKNNAGKDGRFGIDTFNALKQFTEGKPLQPNLSTQTIEPFELPITAAPLLDMQLLPQRAPVTQNTSETSEGNEEGGGVKDFLKNTALKSLPGLAKGIEYMNTYNTLNNMLPPPDLTLNRPQYLNTNVDISADLNALNEAGVMRERALTDSSTKANNVRTNLAGQDAAFNKVRNKLFQDQRNKEMQLQNAQTAMNFKTEDENRKRIYDNAMNQRDFINDQSRARRDFTSGVVGDVMDYTTQNTDRQSQMARMNALMPYLNQFGVFDRAYDEDFLNKYPFMKELLGLKT